MARLLFEKTDTAIWISHLDLMRLFQRAFKRTGFCLKHTQGFNPRPSVSIALPLSVGVSSRCELLDFELEAQPSSWDEVTTRLNDALIPGVRVLKTYENGGKLKQLGLLSCCLTFEYDQGLPRGVVEEISQLFQRNSLLVEKRGKNGPVMQDVIPLIQKVEVVKIGVNNLKLQAVICCQEPSLNPMQLLVAIERELPQYRPDFVHCERLEIYDREGNIFR